TSSGTASMSGSASGVDCEGRTAHGPNTEPLIDCACGLPAWGAHEVSVTLALAGTPILAGASSSLGLVIPGSSRLTLPEPSCHTARSRSLLCPPPRGPPIAP